MKTKRAINAAIQTFLREHAKRPFELLRERSVQGRLAELIREKLGPNVTTTADIYACGAKKWIGISAEKPQKISRVQLELKIGMEGTLRSSDKALKRWRKDPEKTLGDNIFDIVVLRESTDNDRIGLYCHVGSGPGDVIAKVAHKDVVAVIEVKASPLFRMDQHKSFDTDLKKLLDLQEDILKEARPLQRPTIECLFVYLDKSMRMYATKNSHDKKYSEDFQNLRNETRHEHVSRRGVYSPIPNAELRFRAADNLVNPRRFRVKLHHLKEVAGKWAPHIRIATRVAD